MATIAIPVETKVRDLIGSVWLGINLVDDGHTIVIGRKTTIQQNHDVFGTDIYLGGGTISQEVIYNYKKYSNANIDVLFLDTEGGIYHSEEAYKSRVNNDAKKYVTEFLAWGQNSGKIAKKSGYESVKTVGHPRFDLLKDEYKEIYDKERELITRQFGEFLLINTNFSIVNHEYMSMKDFEKRVHQDRISHQLKTLEMFDDLILELGKRDINVVIRPHPSESHSYYQNKYEMYDNIHTVHEGNVRPWINASCAVIHNNCTTAIESKMLNNPTLSYGPGNESYGKITLANDISENFESKQNILNRLEYLYTNPMRIELSEDEIDKIRKYIANIEFDSVEKICRIVSNYNTRETTYNPKSKEYLKRIIVRAGGDSALSYTRSLAHGNRGELSNRKFGCITKQDIESATRDLLKLKDMDTVKVDEFRSLESAFRIME